MKRTVMVVAAVLALTMAGGAFAAGQLTGKSIKDGSLTGKDIKDHSVTKTDLKGNFTGPRGPAGAQGIQGAQGAQGPAGAAGASGITSIIAAQGDGTGSAFAACPAGTKPVSGGGIEDGDGYLWVSGMAINDAGQTGWVVAGNDASPVSAFAYCSSGVQRITLPNGTQGRGMMRVEKVRAQTAARR
jgi:hypothetical protein